MSEAIRKQNWFVVAIEVLVVVVGIFIGRQVDDWNQARRDRADEKIFIERLHEDIVLAEELSNRVRARRLERLQTLYVAADIVFGRSDRQSLTQEECSSIVSSSYFNINVAGFPSVTELVATGRMHIIRDAQLRSSLVYLEQVRGTLINYINVQTIASIAIGTKYPGIVQMESYYDTDLNEARSHLQCDLGKMRASQDFLNDMAIGIDRYDAYIRDGLAPWSEQFDKVHALVDETLGLRHGNP
jgi:hypothetical protein